MMLLRSDDQSPVIARSAVMRCEARSWAHRAVIRHIQYSWCLELQNGVPF